MNAPFDTSRERSAEAVAAAPPARRLRAWQRGAIVLLPVSLIAGGIAYGSADNPQPAPPPPVTVTVAQPLIRSITEWDEYIGRFAASRSVEVRPRVAGAITGVHFSDGAYVQRGQLLFSIDPRPFQAALAEAQAAVASARSDLALARADLSRAERLIEIDAVSASDVDQLRARVQAANASLAAAQARVRSRALDLEFSQVRAPISGRISDRRVDAGNLVGSGEAGGTLLTTINALDPIYFSFEGSEALFLKARRAQQEGGGAAAVQIRLQDETGYRWSGIVDFTDNGIDERSGTIRGRAVIRNPDAFLTPGMFGNMRLAAGGTRQALLVPDAAVQTDQARKVVMVFQPDGSLMPKPVETGPLVDGLRIIRSGLDPRDQVVIEGAQLAMPGMKVQAKRGRVAPAQAEAPQPLTTALAGEATLTR
jgi:membrane fusion protein, multidrug efflux system